MRAALLAAAALLSLALLLLAHHALATTISGGSASGGSLGGPAAEPPTESFLALQDSAHWGTGGSVLDLTDAIPQFTALSESHGDTSPALPLDTSGWSTVTLDGGSCTPTGFSDAVSSISSCNTVVDVSACSVIEWDRTNTAPTQAPAQFNPTACKRGLVLRGNPTTRTIFRNRRDGDFRVWSGGNNGTNAGLREGLLLVGPTGTGNTLNTITNWTWTGGQALNSTSGTVSGTFLGVYPGDAIILKSAQWSGSYATNALGGTKPRLPRKVVCAKWSDGSVKGSACAGDANGTIRWDRPLTADFRTAGPYYFSSNYTSQQIQHVARLSTDDAGTYPITSGNTLVHVGVENIEFQSTRKHIYNGSMGLQMVNVIFGWVINSKFTNWSNDALSLGCIVCTATVTGESAGILVSQNEFEGPIFAQRGFARVTSLATTNPVQLTLTTADTGSGATHCVDLYDDPPFVPGPPTVQTSGSPDGKCDANWNQNVYWDGGGLEPLLYFPPECSEPGIRGYRSHSIHTAWIGPGNVTVTLDGVNGAGMDTNPDCVATLLREYDSAHVRMDSNAFGHLIEDNDWLNTRINVMVQGPYETIVGYNQMETEAGWAGQRGFFDHEGGGPYLVEGNWSNANWIVPLASAGAAGPGRGPHAVYFRNEFVRNGVPAAQVFGTHGGCQTPFCAGYSTDTSSTGVRGEFHVWLGNIISGYGGADINNATLWNKVRVTGNLWRNFDATNNLNDVNAESVIVGNTNNASEMSESDRGRDYPTSLYRTTVPSWWCAESGAFPNVGAPSYTSTNEANLPAGIRRRGGSCTAP